MKIVFVHGRSQERKSPAELERAWTNAAIEGMGAAGLPPLPKWDVAFPYYGDLLFDLTEQAGREAFKDLVDRGAEASAPSAEEQQFTQDIILQMAQSKGITPEQIADEANLKVVDRAVQNWKIVLAALRLLDRVQGVGQASIELATRDVWYYLSRKGIRAQIDALVDAEIPREEPCVVVSHSLGTIVAYNVLMNRAGRANVKALITIGSPLGINAVYSRLPSDTPPRKAPEGVATWFNGRDAQDVVALYEIGADVYRGSPAVTNYSGAENKSNNQHGIVEYLEDTTIAKAIYQSVTAR